MGKTTGPDRGVTEDELLLADMEGTEVARATVAYGRDRRRREGLKRWGQLQRIAEVYGLGELDAFDDVRLRVLHQVIGYVDEHVWRDAVAEVRHHVLEASEGEGWFPQLAEQRTMREDTGWITDQDQEAARPVVADEKALFEPDTYAVADMTLTRREALSRARKHLADEDSPMVVHDDAVHPNPYQDLWIVEYLDPELPDEILDGGGPIIVPAVGDPYRLGSLPPRPVEMIGAILPPDEEWD